MPSPSDLIQELSVNAISVMSKSAYGSILGPVVSDELIDVLGLGSTNNSDAYFEKISGQLQAIQDQLKALAASVSQILDTETVIEEAIVDVEIQAALARFSDHADPINTAFEAYKNCVAQLASADPGQQKEGAGQMFELLGLENALTIVNAMKGVQSAFLPTQAEQKGLIEYQNAFVASTIDAACRAFDAFVPKTTMAKLWFPISDANGNPGQYSGYNLFVEAQKTATDTLNRQVLSTFRAFVVVAMKGLVLLNAAWLHSGQESQVQTQVDSTLAVLKAMSAYQSTFAPAVDAAVSAALKSFCRPLPDAMVNAPWCNGGGGSISYPFSPDWVQWIAFYYRTLMIVAYRPWAIDGVQFMQVDPFETGPDNPVWALSCAEPPRYTQFEPFSGPTRYDPNAPADLVAFLAPLANLPSDPSASDH